MPTRYADEAEYGREARRIRTERDGRDTRDSREQLREREVRPAERRMEVEPRQPMRMPEPELLRTEQRAANSGAPLRQDTRAVRTVPPPRDRDQDRDQDMDMYDVRSTQYPPPPVRGAGEARRIPYEGEFDEIPARIRPVIDPGRTRDEPRPNYNEYFLPGEGIDREVIQSEICRYLGQDATCKPGTHNDV